MELAAWLTQLHGPEGNESNCVQVVFSTMEQKGHFEASLQYSSLHQSEMTQVEWGAAVD